MSNAKIHDDILVSTLGEVFLEKALGSTTEEHGCKDCEFSVSGKLK